MTSAVELEPFFRIDSFEKKMELKMAITLQAKL